MNLHFEDTDKDLDILPTTDGKFWQYTRLSVDAQDKLATSWGWIKGYGGL